MFIFGFLFVCVLPMMWQVLGKMPACIAQERPCHTVITHDSDCKRRSLCSLGIVSCEFKWHQTCHLILRLIFWLLRSFKMIRINTEYECQAFLSLLLYLLKVLYFWYYRFINNRIGNGRNCKNGFVKDLSYKIFKRKAHTLNCKWLLYNDNLNLFHYIQ